MPLGSRLWKLPSHRHLTVPSHLKPNLLFLAITEVIEHPIDLGNCLMFQNPYYVKYLLPHQLFQFTDFCYETLS